MLRTLEKMVVTHKVLLPSAFYELHWWFAAIGIQLDWFVDAERLVPPKAAHYSIPGSKCQSEELKLSQSKPLFTACNTLEYEPKTFAE